MYVGIVCLKKRKKHSGREQQLQSCITEDSLKNLQSIANEMGDEQLSNRITVMSTRNEVILYHKICKLNYTNALQSKMRSEAKKVNGMLLVTFTSWTLRKCVASFLKTL
jgi:hypothetical protein